MELPYKNSYIVCMNEIVNKEIEKYMLDSIPPRDSVLVEMEEYAASRNFPIIGPLVGRLLYMIAKSVKAKRVLELGSGFGYSAYWFAKGMGKSGKVVCTEGSPENSVLAAEYFKRGKMSSQIDFHVGDALKIIERVHGTFDIIFNDIDKVQYPKVLKKALPKLRKGGIFISDNVLWGGRVLDAKPDSNTAGILTFNRMLYASDELFTTIVPLRDGVSISVKLS